MFFFNESNVLEKGAGQVIIAFGKPTPTPFITPASGKRKFTRFIFGY